MLKKVPMHFVVQIDLSRCTLSLTNRPVFHLYSFTFAFKEFIPLILIHICFFDYVIKSECIHNVLSLNYEYEYTQEYRFSLQTFVLYKYL